MNKILIVGSNWESTSTFYKQLGLNPSQLVTELTQNYDVGHTSIQDVVDYDVFEKLLRSATKVFWAHPAKTEFYDLSSFVDFLNWFRDYQTIYKNVVNFNEIKFDQYHWHDKIKKLTNNDMVFFGCSHTYGTGLSDPTTQYANRVAKYFNKNCVNLAQPGGSNSWIFNKFVQTQFLPGQMVVVQLTGLGRLRYVNKDGKISNVLFNTPNDKLKSMIDVYNDKYLFYNLLYQVIAMVELARSKQLKMIFWLWNYKGEYTKEDQTYFYDMPEFVPATVLENFAVDLAEDNIHFGIQSNQIIASKLVEYMKQIYEC